MAAGDDESLPPVKKRRTKNFKWREDMAKKSRPAGPTVVTRVPPLEPVTFNTWDEFIAAWTEYMAATKTLYRRRSSCSTAIWNSRNRYKKYPVPDSFPYATMAYWCTHGCIQPSRGTGVRAHLHNRFTGCTARITADVVFEKTDETHVRWFIRVRNQISQHNHRISDEIYNCYTNNSSVPDELLLGETVGVETALPQSLPASRTHQAMTSPSHRINRTQNSQVHDDVALLDGGHSVSTAAAIDGTRNDVTGSLGNTASLLMKEVLADDQKVNMARSEIQPLLEELQRTPSRVIHKRLQDVSDMVLHLLAKWHQDRANEDRHLLFIAQSAAATTAAALEASNSPAIDLQPRLPPSRTLLTTVQSTDESNEAYVDPVNETTTDPLERQRLHEASVQPADSAEVHVQTEVI
ncbi:hypothetical protein PINS_up002856 [Pythium insidiosum]|nr:hypothetical protein PINS_up002856 [Pythium insidiosum]